MGSRTEQPEPGKVSSRGRKILRRLLITAIVICIFFIILLLLLPVYLSSGSGNEFILNKINSAGVGTVSAEAISISWFSGIEIDSLRFVDPSGARRVSVSKIRMQLSYLKLMRRRLVFGKTTITAPSVEIDHVRQKPLGQSTLGDAALGPVAAPLLAEKIELIVTDGVFVITSAERSLKLDDINLSLNLQRAPELSLFDLSLAVMGDGEKAVIKASGGVTVPAMDESPDNIAGSAAIDVETLDLESLALLFELADLGIEAQGLVGGSAKISFEKGSCSQLAADITGENLSLGGRMFKGDRIETKVLDIKTQLRCDNESISVDKLDIETDWLSSSIAGNVPRTIKSMADFLRHDSVHSLKGRFKCDLASVSTLMRQSLALKDDVEIVSGMADGDVYTGTENGSRVIICNGKIVDLETLADGRAITIAEPITATVKVVSDKSGTTKLDRAHVTSSFGLVSCSGTSKRLEYEFGISDLKLLQEKLAVFVDLGGYRIGGSPHGKGTVIIEPDRIFLTNSLTLNDITADFAELQDQVLIAGTVESKLRVKKDENWRQLRIDEAEIEKLDISVNGSSLAGAGRIELSKQGTIFEKSSATVNVNLKEFNLTNLAVLLKGLKINAETAGKVSGTISAKLNGGLLEDVAAEIKGTDLDILVAQLKGDRFKTRAFGLATKLQCTQALIKVEQLDIKTDWLTSSLSGEMPTTIAAIEDFIKYDSPYSLKGEFDCDLPKTMTMFSNTLDLKDGIKVTYGRLSGNIETSSKKGKRAIAGETTLWALEGNFPIRSIILSKPLNFDGKIISDKSGTRIEKANFKSAFGSVKCAGAVDSLAYEAEVDLAKLQRDMVEFVEMKSQIQGQINAKGNFDLTQDIFGLKSSGTVKDFVFAAADGTKVSEALAKIEFAASADRALTVLKVNDLDIDSAACKLKITDSTIPLKSDTEVELKLLLSVDADLEKLRPFAVILAGLDSRTQMAGKLRSSFLAVEENKMLRIATKEAVIDKLSIDYPGQPKFSQEQISGAFDGRFSRADNSFDIRQLHITSPQINISKGKLARSTKGGMTTLTGVLEAKCDLEAVSAVLRPFLPSGFMMKGDWQDNIEINSTYPADQGDKLLANLNLKTDLGFDEAAFMGLNFGQTKTTVEIKDGILTISPFTTTVNQGKFFFAGSADFNKKPSMLRIPEPNDIIEDVQVTAEMTKQFLTYVNPVFADVTNASGSVSLSCDELAIPLAGADKNHLEIVGVFQGKNMQLQASSLLGQIIKLSGGRTNVPISIDPTAFVLRNGVLSYDNMQLNIGDRPINFKGRIRLDKSMEMDITLPWQAGGERVTLSVEGTVDRPKINMEKLLIQEGLKQLLKRYK